MTGVQTCALPIFYESAAEYGDNSEKAKVQAEIAKMYRDAVDACIADAKEKGKGFNRCDALAKKEKKHMNDAIKAQGRVKGDDSMEALAGMKQEKIARFGMDGNFNFMYIQGYGSFNRMGGSYDSEKFSAYQQSQQQFLMNMMMRQSMGAYGAQPGAGGESGGFFR